MFTLANDNCSSSFLTESWRLLLTLSLYDGVVPEMSREACRKSKEELYSTGYPMPYIHLLKIKPSSLTVTMHIFLDKNR